MTTMAKPPQLKKTENSIPFESYERMRGSGELLWDESVGGWVGTTYSVCKEIFKRDKSSFRHPDGDADQPFHYISGGRRTLKTVVGDEHKRLHNWMMMTFSPVEASHLQHGVVRDVIVGLIDDIKGKQKAELVRNFVDHIPVRVIAAVCGLPWKDRVWMSDVKTNLDLMAAYFNQRNAADRELIEQAKTGMDTLRGLFDPYIEASRTAEANSLLSRLWVDGPSILEGWSAEDAFTVLTTVMLAGADTSTLAISNALYLLLTDAELKERVRVSDEKEVATFVEEALRLLPPVHYRSRRAMEDTQLAGRTIKEGEFVLPLIASANRDEGYYACPHAVDFERRPARDHLSFAAGPRSCIGSNLARAEIIEAVRQILDIFPNIALDTAAEPPAYTGLVLRRFAPLNVLLNPI